MLISIAIPAFKRAKEICELLDSIERQNRPNTEIIICEDCSPEQDLIEKSVLKYKRHFPNLKFFKNKKNLGYDANLRNVIAKSSGEYVLLCGNDDIFPDNALSIVEAKLNKYSPVVLLRSYKSFYKEWEEKTKLSVHRYVKKDTLVDVDEKELAWLFYRSVLVSGLVINRELANKYASEEVDGMLYYQSFIISQVAKHGKVLYVPDFIIYNRLLDFGDFGTSDNEKEGMTPGERTIESSVYQMTAFFNCAKVAQQKRELNFVTHLKKIASAYSFPLLGYHRDKGLTEFLRYCLLLRKIGYQGPYFYFYQLLLILFQLKFSFKLITFLKLLFGQTIRLIR